MRYRGARDIGDVIGDGHLAAVGFRQCLQRGLVECQAVAFDLCHASTRPCDDDIRDRKNIARIDIRRALQQVYAFGKAIFRRRDDKAAGMGGGVIGAGQDDADCGCSMAGAIARLDWEG